VGKLTLREHLEIVWQQTGVMPPELDVPDAPEFFTPLVRVFKDISETRQSGMGGPLPISYNEIKSYFELTGLDYCWETVRLIKVIDNAYLEAMAALNE